MANDSQPIQIGPPRFRFVLVETSEPGNIGSAARVLANFGFTPADLVLAEPHCDWRSPKAVSRAGQAHEWLGKLRVFPRLPEAIGDCVRVVGATAQVIEKFRRQFAHTVEEAMPALVTMARENSVAVLFGTEQTGLTHEQLLACDELITIPTSPLYPSLNLAVAVGITAYEAVLISGSIADAPIVQPTSQLPPEEQPAEARLVDIMFRELYQAAETIEFFNPQNPLPLQYALRRILGKAHLTNQEARVLLGLARQILWKCGKKP